MKKSIYTLFTICSLALSGAALAETPKGPMKFAFVDMQAAILQTEQGKAAKANIEKQAESKRKELQKQKEDLNKAQEAYQAERGVLSEEARAQKERDLQGKAQSLYNSQMGMEKELRDKEMQETQKIYQNLSGIIDEISKKKGYDLVFERGAGALLYASKIDDLTAEAVKIYNDKHKDGGKKAKK